MSTFTDQKQERQYYIDWLRILLILSVFLFHIGMIFNNWPWHIKNEQQFGGLLKQVMTFLHYWRMPLLFMLSGAGTYFALGKRTPGQYLSERFKRLVIPLAAGIFILVPVQVYIERIPQYTSLPAYYPHMFEGIYPDGNFSWHHLWFIAYLFVVSLFISPFLNFLRSDRFKRFTHRIADIVTKPFALNIFIIPLLLSQILLCPFFETGTNALVNDWASMTYYIIFFLSGYILIPIGKITEAMRTQRFYYLSEVVIVTICMFRITYLIENEALADLVGDTLSIFLAWSCSITAIGFAKQHFNRDSVLRRLGNEAIYPFYLLHQPVIVVIGYFVIKWEIPVPMKAVIMVLLAFTSIVTLYWFIIRPFNPFRVIFGMKIKMKNEEEPAFRLVLNPSVAETDESGSGMNQGSFKRNLALNQ